MKNVPTSHDISALVAEYQALVGLYLDNIYDVDRKTLILKLKHKQEKVFLLMESGQRNHTIENFTGASTVPKSFCVKIRKHVKNRRLWSIRQINYDRVIDFQFGSPEDCYHIILELYASGNIILTNSEYLILDLVHFHRYDNDQDQDTEGVKNDPDEKRKNNQSVLVRPSNHYPFEHACSKMEDYDLSENALNEWQASVESDTKRKKFRDVVGTAPFSHYGMILIEHALDLQNVSIKQKVGGGEFPVINWNRFMTELQVMLKMFDHPEETKTKQSNIVIESKGYYPCTYSQFKKNDEIDPSYNHREFKTFDLAVRFWYDSMKGLTINRNDQKITKQKAKDNKVKKADITGSIKERIQELEDKKTDIMKVIDSMTPYVSHMDLIVSHIKMLYDHGYTIDIEKIRKAFCPPGSPISLVSIDMANRRCKFELPCRTDDLKVEEQETITVDIDWMITTNRNISELYGSVKKLQSKILKSQSAIITIPF